MLQARREYVITHGFEKVCPKAGIGRCVVDIDLSFVCPNNPFKNLYEKVNLYEELVSMFKHTPFEIEKKEEFQFLAIMVSFILICL